MNDSKRQSGGGHEGLGGIQNHSCGSLYPWSIYVLEHYLPRDRAPGRTNQERFLWAEIRLQNPDGRDLFLADYFRGYDQTSLREAHRRADRNAERSVRLLRVLDTMRSIRNYGRPA